MLLCCCGRCRTLSQHQLFSSPTQEGARHYSVCVCVCVCVCSCECAYKALLSLSLPTSPPLLSHLSPPFPSFPFPYTHVSPPSLSPLLSYMYFPSFPPLATHWLRLWYDSIRLAANNSPVKKLQDRQKGGGERDIHVNIICRKDTTST